MSVVSAPCFPGFERPITRPCWSDAWRGTAAPASVLPASSGCQPAKRCADLRKRRSSMSESRQVIGRTRRSSCTDRGCDETTLCGRWTRAGVRHRPANSTPFLRSAPGQECPGWRTCAGPISGPVIRDARTQTDLRTALSPYAVPIRTANSRRRSTRRTHDRRPAARPLGRARRRRHCHLRWTPRGNRRHARRDRHRPDLGIRKYEARGGGVGHRRLADPWRRLGPLRTGALIRRLALSLQRGQSGTLAVWRIVSSMSAPPCSTISMYSRPQVIRPSSRRPKMTTPRSLKSDPSA